MNDKTESDLNTSRRIKRLVAGLLSTIFLGALGSGLWDAIFKPGIGTLAHFFTQLSDTLDDHIFTSAALNPEPVVPLVFLMGLLLLPIAAAIWFFFMGFLRSPLLSSLDNYLEMKLSKKAPDEKRRFLLWGLKGISSLGIVISFGLLFLLWLGFSIQSEAVLVWRVFHKNFEICAPYMEPEQRLNISSAFRRITNRKDFAGVKQSLDEVASSHGIDLEWYGPNDVQQRAAGKASDAVYP